MSASVHRAGLAFAFVVAVASTQLAHAGLFRAYLSVNGNDANPCTVVAPCRLLPAALNAINDGAEIWILDSANFNVSQVLIAKSVSILAIPGAVGSVVATGGGDALLVNAPNIKVTLRNLVIARLGANHHGIEFVQGAELNVEDCEVLGATVSGIQATAFNGKVSVKNTVLRDNGQDGFVASGFVFAVLDRVHSLNNSIGVHAANGANVAVANSVLWNNVFGAMSSNDSVEGTTELVVAHSTVGGGNTGLVVNAGPDPTENASLTTDGNVITHNSSAFSFNVFNATGTIYTRQNNTVQFNDSGNSAAGLTPLGAI